MKLSVLDLVPILAGADSAEALRQALRLAQTAERLGCHRYWAAEHHDLPGLACPAPEVLLAHIGAQTERIRLGTGALLLPHYKPLKVAETFHLLASLYPGRIDLGLGRAPGGSAHTTIALSGNFLENVRQLPHTLQALTELLTGTFLLEGEPVHARPTPPHPPEVWLLGTNRRSAAYAAEYGTGYVFGQFMSDLSAGEVIPAYREAFRPSPLAAEPRVIAAVGVVCAETEAAVEALAAQAPWLQPDAAAPGDAAGGQPPQGRLLTGTAAQVRAQLEQYAAQHGVDEFLVVTPARDYGQRLRSYELLCEAAR